MDQKFCNCGKRLDDNAIDNAIWCYGCHKYVCDKCDCLVAELCWDCWEQEQNEIAYQEYLETQDPYEGYDPDRQY